MGDTVLPRSDASLVVLSDQEVLRFLTGSIDRSLPTHIGAQLRGAIEYGVASRALPPGTRLPSIRTLAQVTGLAAETVAAAYKALQAGGLLTSFQGSGTFVSDAEIVEAGNIDARQALEQAVDHLLTLAQEARLPLADLITMLRLRHAPTRSPAPLHLAMIGIFEDATQAYAKDIQHHLKPDDVVAALTVDQLRASQGQPVPDLYITLPSRQSEVVGIVGKSAPVTSVGLIPSEATRSFLASLDPHAALALVAKYPGFMEPMRQSAQAFAPHLRSFATMAADDVNLAARLGRADVVVYSTGADAVRGLLTRGQPTAEFRHTLDPHALRDTLLPLLDSLRRRKSTRPGVA
ncbi:MAG: GntR family transcriptional regulator [Candidatus Saccharibacteria bacterium]|nr:GntR family transcriptional regulator [Pseudorhodobacter sp.]